MNVYMSGTLVTSNAQFQTGGVPTDPSSVTFKYKLGNGTVQTVVYPSAPIVRNSVGSYSAGIDTTGWSGPGNRPDLTEWIGTGACQVIGTDVWEVEPPLL
jgi:hypothetical protein